MTVRLHIDWTACDGRGLCTELLPELLQRDVWGFPLPRENQPREPRDARPHAAEPEVPGALHGHARRAVDRCPRQALRLLDR